MADEVEDKQVKNLRNKVRDFINKTTPESLVRVAVYCRLPIPKPLILKYLSQSGKRDQTET